MTEAVQSPSLSTNTGIAQARHRLLVLVRPGQDSEPVLRMARKLALSFHASWLALYVEPATPLADAQQWGVSRELELARELGADVLTTADDDVLNAVLRIAAQRDISQLVVGKSSNSGIFRNRDSLVSALLRQSGELAVHIVPVGNSREQPIGAIWKTRAPALIQYGQAFAVIGFVTLATFLLTPIVGRHATALLYLLSVVLLGLFVERGPTLVAAAMSAVLWDYFSLPPIYAFRINHFEDAMMLGTYFVVALVLGHLTARIRAQEEAERQREARATALFLLTRELTESAGLDQMLQKIVGQLASCFKAKVAVLLPGDENKLKPHLSSTLQLPQTEQNIPQWVWQHRDRAGKFTNHSATATALYLPLTTSGGPVGVLALQFAQSFGPTIHQKNLLDAFCQQIAMALDRHRLNGISEKAKLLAESERLSKTLLDSMSHEIRTPIAVIKSATGNLSELSDSDSLMRHQMLAEIQEATERLNRLVGNVLEASRLESGTVKPRFTECDIGELVNITLADIEKELGAHKVALAIQPGLPLVSMDFVLMQQALGNLLSNATLHTPPGTPIELSARLENESLLLSVADKGPGIPPACLPRIFDKFFRVPNSRTGGTGLGLSLVKGFVEAQGGKVTAENRPGGGAAFTICLPQSHLSPVPAKAEL